MNVFLELPPSSIPVTIDLINLSPVNKDYLDSRSLIRDMAAMQQQMKYVQEAPKSSLTLSVALKILVRFSHFVNQLRLLTNKQINRS